MRDNAGYAVLFGNYAVLFGDYAVLCGSQDSAALDWNLRRGQKKDIARL